MGMAFVTTEGFLGGDYYLLAEVQNITYTQDVVWVDIPITINSTSSGSGGGGSGGGGSSNPTTIDGTTLDDVISAVAEDVTYNGLAGFDELQYLGTGSTIDKFVFTENSDGTVTSESTDFGTDILSSIEGVWFEESDLWLPVNELLVITTDTPSGTSGDDVLIASTGDDTHTGGTGWDELQFLGSKSHQDDFILTKNVNGTLTVQNTTFGTDTLDSIEGIWFEDSETYVIVADIPVTQDDINVVLGTTSDDLFTGQAGDDIYQDTGGFDQIDYTGNGSSVDDFHFALLDDGGVQVQSDVFGTDTFYDVESVWFESSGQWSLFEDLIV